MALTEKLKKQIDMINQHHCLMVFPIKNKPDIMSLWKALYPKTTMRWEWTEDADNRVVQLWHSREQLSKSGEVVYSKWFQNRATFFSKKLFVQLLAYFETAKTYDMILNGNKNQSRNMRLILEALDMDSPISTKQVKEACELQGRLNEPAFNKTTKYLWQNLCLIAFGEINDSSFPSLGYASPKILFEDLWLESQKISVATAEKEIVLLLKSQPEVLKWLGKIKKSM